MVYKSREDEKMNVIQCPNKHFYDRDQFDRCPHCLKEMDNIQEDPYMKTPPIKDDPNRTVLKIKTKKTPQETKQPVKSGKPVVGWLICVKGEYFGESFSLFSGKNSIGSNKDNNIALVRDSSIEQISHTWIAFDKNNNFLVLPGTGASYVDNMLVKSPKYLKNRDFVKIGDGIYMLITLCGKDFDWQDYLTKE